VYVAGAGHARAVPIGHFVLAADATNGSCSRPDDALVTSATARPGRPSYASESAAAPPARREEMIGSILSSVFQLIGDILGFVGAILNAIF